MLKDGDLVRVLPGYHRWNKRSRSSCDCFFCFHESKEVGIVTSTWLVEGSGQSAIIEFDVGQWVFRDYEYVNLDVVSVI